MLYRNWYECEKKLPKKDRFTIGQKVEIILLDTLTFFIQAYHTKKLDKKLSLLGQMNANLDCLKIIIRLAKDIKAIREKRYFEYENSLQEIGRMLGGWTNSLTKTDGY